MRLQILPDGIYPTAAIRLNNTNIAGIMQHHAIVAVFFIGQCLRFNRERRLQIIIFDRSLIDKRDTCIRLNHTTVVWLGGIRTQYRIIFGTSLKHNRAAGVIRIKPIGCGGRSRVLPIIPRICIFVKAPRNTQFQRIPATISRFQPRRNHLGRKITIRPMKITITTPYIKTKIHSLAGTCLIRQVESYNSIRIGENTINITLARAS